MMTAGLGPTPPLPAYPDPCTPVPPVPIRQPAALKVATSRWAVDNTKPVQLVGGQALRRTVTITNQGDGLGGGSRVFVSGLAGKDNLAGQGAIIPVGAGRDFDTQDELWAIADPTGVPAGGNIIDVVNLFDA